MRLRPSRIGAVVTPKVQRQRLALDAMRIEEVGDRCGGCDNSRVEDWRLARRGLFLVHGAGKRRACRFPMRGPLPTH